ncbi:UDP-3-O-(3-hydroxymyristoyl)glucosamine N-acyltransferase [Sutterella sp.]|uniref:UDP-3-O-(3-hydroxymyristoyl)glucosamine N-acyltransferase n=1 Tax=Sutterella sp. TaxID=1981025 RepID=UPI0026DF189D|nr:UDP-3-O-(3-hydroxymyristoyl)glucosamine N-acyltransferase [Sutterella sp.]MDO5531184.1 UDP-3-O-(3-hydroxymyristoyl)glucosamine N-acyltransferase [Sutterella sp.]
MSQNLMLSKLVEAVNERAKGRLSMRISGEDVPVGRFMPPDQAGEGDLSFLTDPRYAEAMKASRAAALVLREKDAAGVFGETLPARTILICDNPYAFFAFASQVFYPVKRNPGIHPRAYVEDGAEVDPTATVDVFAVVRRGAKIGPRALISSGVVVGENCEVGADTIIYPNAVLYEGTVVGEGGCIQSGAVLGGDGFGFAPFRGEWVKIPQRGRTVLGNEVEIGANTTVDRGALEDTVVGEGTKLDNQVQIGHNDRIGRHCVMASCVGIAGSTTVGDHVMIGGAAMINGHITIPSGSGVGPATAITGWGKEPAEQMGFFPALSKREFMLSASITARLPEMRRDLKRLEKEVEQLRALIRKEEAKEA